MVLPVSTGLAGCFACDTPGWGSHLQPEPPETWPPGHGAAKKTCENEPAFSRFPWIAFQKTDHGAGQSPHDFTRNRVLSLPRLITRIQLSVMITSNKPSARGAHPWERSFGSSRLLERERGPRLWPCRYRMPSLVPNSLWGFGNSGWKF